MLKLFNRKKTQPEYDTKKVMVYEYELKLLRQAAYCRGERKEAIDKIKAFTLWRLANGK